MSTDTMSTTDNQVLADILNTLQGLSPPPILGTISKSLDALSGSFDKSIKPLIDAVDLVTQSVDKVTGAVDKVTGAVGKLSTDLTEVINASTNTLIDKLGTNWILEGLNLIIGVLGLFKVETLEKMLKKITPIISKIISTFKVLGSRILALGPLIMGVFANMKTAMIPVLRSLAMMTANFVRVGLSALVTGAQMAAAWVVGLGPIAWVVATVVGVFALVATNIDYLQGAWGKFVSWFSTSFPNLSKLLEPVTNTITWILEKIKQITEFGGGIVDKLFGKDSTDQVAPPVLAQQVFTPISAPSQALLPMTPTSIINKASVTPKSIPQIAPDLAKVATVDINQNKELPAISNPTKNISPIFNTIVSACNSSHGAKGSSTSNTNSSHHHQNVYNIANIDIADGMISDLEDLIQAINRHAC